MDLSSVIIGLITFAIFIVPLFYLQKTRKNKEKQLLQSFLELATRQELKLTTHESWSNFYCIGIDAEAKKLLYLKKRSDKEETKLIDLAEIKKCQIVKTTIQSDSSPLVNELYLAFIPASNLTVQQSIEFYNREESMGLHGELQLIEKWEAKINAMLL